MRTSGLITAAISLALLCLVGCGGSTTTAGTGIITVSSITPSTFPVASTTPFVIGGDNFSQLGGAWVVVRFTATTGTPFLGGTSDSVDVPALIMSATQISGDMPPTCVSGGVTVTADFVVMFPSGLDAAGTTATFEGPSLAAGAGNFSPTTVPCEIPQTFTMDGTGLGAVGDPLTVRFDTGGPAVFMGGTSSTVEVPATVTATGLTGTTPAALVCGIMNPSAAVTIILSNLTCSSPPPEISTGGPVVTFAAPTVTALNVAGFAANASPSTVLLGAATPETFTLSGTGFAPTGGAATVRFSGAGIFDGGANFVDVAAMIVNDTTLSGTLPTITAPRLTADASAGVAATLPSGTCTPTALGLATLLAPPTITSVVNNRGVIDQTNVAATLSTWFLACVPTDTDINGTAFSAGITHLIYDAGAGPGTPIGPGVLGAPAITAPGNISGTSPQDNGIVVDTPTTFRVVNPDNQFHDLSTTTFSARAALANVNSTRQPGLNSECLIGVNPTNPANAAMFVHADPADTAAFDEMALSYTTDYGLTWTITTIDDAVDGYAATALRFDPAMEYDRFGNLYICYGVVGSGVTTVLLLQSTDGGASFGNARILAQAPGFSHDRWTLATGLEPVTGGEAVYAAWTSFAVAPIPIVVNGCISTGLGNLGAPFAPPAAPVVVSDGVPPGLQWQNGYPGVGPNGELYVSFFDIPPGAGPVAGDIYLDVDTDGLWSGTNTFGTDALVATSNVGWKSFILPQPQRGYGANPQIVPITTGAFAGRILLCYTHEFPDETTPAGVANGNTLVVTQFSDDGGGSWSMPVSVHVDTSEHQFMHWLTCDSITGRMYVSWFDCREDPGNTLTRRMCASSADGQTWTTELKLAQGQSNATGNRGQDYLEYCGTSVVNGCGYAAWTDFSNFTGDNPNGTIRSDVFVSVFMHK